VPTLAEAAPAFNRQVEDRLDARYLTLIRNWAASNCTSADPADHPTRQMAPNWEGPGQLCGSCARCRPEQRAPGGDWNVWLYLAGRGSGKTRSCAEYVAHALATQYRWRVAVVAPTYADARDICIEGESGLQAVFERWGWTEGPKADYVWNRSLGELTVKTTGSRVKLFTAEKPNSLRGPQHHLVWVEELAQVVKRASDAWDMMKFGLRLGRHPRTVCSTTPLPVSLIKDLIVDPRAVVARGKTDDNAANLPEDTLRDLHKKYDNTRLGRQELDGDILDDVPGALWRRSWLDDCRVWFTDLGPTFSENNELLRPERPALIAAALDAIGVTLIKIDIGVDPAVESGEDSDETGILVVGKASNGRYYVLDDVSLRETPDMVMDRLVATYDLYEANEVITEVNNGGAYIGKALRDTLKLKGRSGSEIRHNTIRAKKGKRVRAEPVSNLYGQGLVSHVGTFKYMEDQLVIWTTGDSDSPDRMDALVYAILHLSDIGDGGGLYSPSGSSIPRHNQQRATIPTSSVGSRR
jgi:predicted phage terminase large subunit-like protein